MANELPRIVILNRSRRREEADAVGREALLPPRYLGGYRFCMDSWEGMGEGLNGQACSHAAYF